MGYEIIWFWCNNGWGASHNLTFGYVLMAHSITYEPGRLYVSHMNGVAGCIISTITSKAWAKIINTQAPFQFWGEAVNTKVYLHQGSPNQGLKRINDRNPYQVPFKTPYQVVDGYQTPTHSANGHEISYQATFPVLCLFIGCPTWLIPEVWFKQVIFSRLWRDSRSRRSCCSVHRKLRKWTYCFEEGRDAVAEAR